MESIVFILIGIGAGVSSGLFGVGGGIIIVPALTYFASFSQHRATGTSLAVMLPPIGIAAAYEYYKKGNIDIYAAIYIAAALLIGAWVGSLISQRISGPTLKLAFGVYVILVGILTVFRSYREISQVSNTTKDINNSIQQEEL
jgi:uncharacterized membrane protein YfcA